MCKMLPGKRNRAVANARVKGLEKKKTGKTARVFGKKKNLPPPRRRPGGEGNTTCGKKKTRGGRETKAGERP